MFTLAISCLTTSNLPWFMDLTFQVPMQYCSLQHWTLLPSPSYPTLSVVFTLAQPLHSTWNYFPHCSPVPYWAPTNRSSSSFSVISFCLFILFMGSQGKNNEMVCHSLFQWTTFCQTSPPWPASLGWPQRAWLSFIELDKAVVHVIRLTSFLWLWFQCVFPLIPSCKTYRLTWVSLTVNVGYAFTAAPAKRSHCSLPWMRGISTRPPLLTLNVE